MERPQGQYFMLENRYMYILHIALFDQSDNKESQLMQHYKPLHLRFGRKKSTKSHHKRLVSHLSKLYGFIEAFYVITRVR